MIIVTASARLQPETRAEALAACAKLQTATAGEQGCLEYRFWTAIDDPDRVLLYERWEDDASLREHLAGPGVAEFGATIAVHADGPADVVRYEVGSAGPLR